MSILKAPALRRRLRVRLSLTAVVVALAGCADDAPLDTLEPKGPSASDIDTLSNTLFIMSAVVFVLIFGACAVIFTRYRVKNHDDDEWPAQTHGNNTLEVGWTVVPAIVMAIVAVLTMSVLFGLYDTEADAITVDAGDGLVEWDPHVVVVGQQWWWEYRYYFDPDVIEQIVDADLPDVDGVVSEVLAKRLPAADIVTSGQMVIPAGEEVELSITSRDVLHSHWIPALNGKRDAVPSKVTPWKVEADRPGFFFGQCTEFCGLSHSRMRMQILALDEGEFQTWVTEQMQPAGAPSTEAATWLASVNDEDPANDLPAPEATAAERGLVAFTQNCAGCHLIDGVNDSTYTGADQVSGAAPNLTHFASRTTFAGALLDTYEANGRFNANDLAKWLRNPESVKAMDPPRRGMPNLGLGEDTINDLIAYLETLGNVPGGQETITQTIVD